MLGVYTVEHCDSGSQAAIKIHEGRACNFVFTCSHALIRARYRNRIESWFPVIFFPSPPKRGRRAFRDFSRHASSTHLANATIVVSRTRYTSLSNETHFEPLEVGVFNLPSYPRKRHSGLGGFSVWLGGNLLFKGRTDNFHPLSSHAAAALNPTEFQGDLISCKISGNRG